MGLSLPASSFALKIIAKIKRRSPDILIVVGGPPCSYALLESSIRPNKSIDIVVTGEGEKSFIEVVRELAKDKSDLSHITGIYYKRKMEVVFTGERPVIENLDKTSFPDFSHFNLDDYYLIDEPDNSVRELPIYASRGCRWNCLFCIDHKIWSGPYRMKSPERVVKELIELSKRYATKQFVFVDLMMNGDIKWLDRFAKLVIDSELNVKFWGLIRANKNLSLELMLKLKKAGLYHICMGIESGDSSVLTKMRKGFTSKIASDNLKIADQAGMTVSMSLICGFPGESLTNYLNTIWFVFRHRKILNNPPSVNVCYVMVGSDLHKDHERHGIQFPSEDVSGGWISNKGRNTPRSRERRRRFMQKIFTRMMFGRIKS